jgi:hypothetical protein
VTLEVTALALTAVVHLIGAAVLVWALLDGDRVDWRRLLDGDADGDGGGGSRRPDEPGPAPGGSPGAVRTRPAAVRLRERGSLAGAHPRVRRPEHPPAREQPVTTPAPR